MTSKDLVYYLEDNKVDSDLVYHWMEFPEVIKPLILETYPEIAKTLEKELIFVKPLNIILFPLAYGIYDPITDNKTKEQELISILNESIGE
jgi:hypothetical protein